MAKIELKFEISKALVPVIEQLIEDIPALELEQLDDYNFIPLGIVT